MTRSWVLVNALTGQIVARGPQTILRRQRVPWAAFYADRHWPFVPEIRLAPRLDFLAGYGAVGDEPDEDVRTLGLG
jgi:hypothetical protein